MIATLPPAELVVGRNHPCPCGSGRKHKHCCLAKPAPVTPNPRTPLPELSFQSTLQRGNSVLASGDPLQAAVLLAEAIRIRPDSAAAISNLGVALLHLGNPQRAITCYRQAIQVDPSFAPAHSNLGQALTQLGHTAEAIAALEAAIALDSNFADAYVNLGAALRTAGRYEDSIRTSRRALALQPHNVEACLNLGNALKEQGQLSEAALSYRLAIRLAPKDPRGYNNLGETYRDQGEPAAAALAYEQALEVQPNPTAYSNLLYLHAFTRDITPAAELELARNYERTLLPEGERSTARLAASRNSGTFAATPLEGRQLRLGIVSAELGTHAVAEFLEPILERLDRTRFHLTLLPTTNRHDDRAQRIRSLADDFLPISTLNDTQAVELIRNQQIDVLLDTSGHTLGNRLGVFARRAAPVQATYVGYWSTTGLTEMDYFIGDPDQPRSLEPHFAEHLWRLPRLGVTYRGDPALALDWQPDPNGHIRLGSFNKFGKIREQTIALWAQALRSVPRSLLVLEDRGTDESESHQRLRSGFLRHGVSADRIRFIPYIPGHERHMLLYNQLDIALDTVPFNSGTTAFDALWMGVPLVTLEGQTMGARIAGAALNALGRRSWVAQTPNNFASTVQILADTLPTDPTARNQLRNLLRNQMSASPLTDATTLTRALETAFTSMYNRWLTS